MLKLLAGPFTCVSVHDISYASSAWNWGEGVMVAGKQNLTIDWTEFPLKDVKLFSMHP